MKAIHSMIAAAALAFVPSAPADAAVGDPEVIIYRFPGVKDNGGIAFAGTATVFFCTNFSGVSETIRFVTRDFDTTFKTNITQNVAHLGTLVMYTHTPAAYVGSTLGTGLVHGGTTAIAATSINIICTAMTIDATTISPVGVALRGIRFSPVPGSQE